MILDRVRYNAECDQRWSGPAGQDARRNWAHFEEMRDDLTRVLRAFRVNPFLKDVAGKAHNPEGTLRDFLWKLQAAWQPDKGCLDPLLDFEEHFQAVFLRRGLVIYCEMILAQLTAAGQAEVADQFLFPFQADESAERAERLGLRQSSGALTTGTDRSEGETSLPTGETSLPSQADRGESGRGLPHSMTLARVTDP
jgi:hypothetical protein